MCPSVKRVLSMTLSTCPERLLRVEICFVSKYRNTDFFEFLCNTSALRSVQAAGRNTQRGGACGGLYGESSKNG